MILFDSLECGDFAHEKADFRGLVHGMFKTEHLRVTCRHGRNGALGNDCRYDPSVYAGGHLCRTGCSRIGRILCDHDHGVFPVDPNGVPFTASYIACTGDPIADLTEDMAADGTTVQEQRGKKNLKIQDFCCTSFFMLRL